MTMIANPLWRTWFLLHLPLPLCGSAEGWFGGCLPEILKQRLSICFLGALETIGHAWLWDVDPVA